MGRQVKETPLVSETLAGHIPADFKAKVRREIREAERRVVETLGGECMTSRCTRVRANDDILCSRCRTRVGVTTREDFDNLLRRCIAPRP